jgi:hypothetical protein
MSFVQGLNLLSIEKAQKNEAAPFDQAASFLLI